MIENQFRMNLIPRLKKPFYLHFEWLVLSAAIILMILINPYSAGFSFCFIDIAGFGFCPGEGLGRSVALFFRGELVASFAMHPAGIPGVFIMIYRITQILNRNRKLKKEMLYEPSI